MYEVGDLIVYGRTGICEVTEITTLKMDGVPKDKLYYILRPVREKRGKVFTPVDNEKIVMRRVISKEEAEEFKEEVQAVFPEADIHMDPLYLSVPCHIGHGALAVACSKKVTIK